MIKKHTKAKRVNIKLETCTMNELDFIKNHYCKVLASTSGSNNKDMISFLIKEKYNSLLSDKF